MPLELLKNKLKELSSLEKAEKSKRFFKVGAGEYSEKESFLGIPNPILHTLAKEFKSLAIPDLSILLNSPYNEERLLALLILVIKFKRGSYEEKEVIYNLYINRTGNINNWNLVDASAQYIVGPFLEDREKDILYKLARSPSLWERRIAIIATWHFIKKKQFDLFFDVALLLLNDKEDLIHKALGWMLREIGKKENKALIAFLKQYYHQLPRTTLRYAIERFPKETRQNYMKGVF